MTSDLRSEFLALREIAMKELHSVAESGSYWRIFTLYKEPSFSPCSRLTLYAPSKPTSDKKPFVASSIWRSDVDGEKYRDPVERLKHGLNLAPTIVHESWDICPVTVSRIGDMLSAIAIPIFQPKPKSLGLDGTSYEFEYNRFFYRLSIRWWEGFPESWRPLIDSVMEVRQILLNEKVG